MSDGKRDDSKKTTNSSDPSRRGLIKTIAWGTPAIAVVTLSRNSLAHAASPPYATTTTTYFRRTTTTPRPTTMAPTTPGPTTARPTTTTVR